MTATSSGGRRVGGWGGGCFGVTVAAVSPDFHWSGCWGTGPGPPCTGPETPSGAARNSWHLETNGKTNRNELLITQLRVLSVISYQCVTPWLCCAAAAAAPGPTETQSLEKFEFSGWTFCQTNFHRNKLTFQPHWRLCRWTCSSPRRHLFAARLHSRQMRT